MASIRLLDWGEFLNTRLLGGEIRDRIIESLSPKEATLIDFSGVVSMSWSFADECFGKLEEQIGRQALQTALSWRGIDSELVLPTMKAVLAERKHARVSCALATFPHGDQGPARGV